MTRANGDGTPQMMDMLCELIVEELKSCSSNRRAISQEGLLQALSGKADILYALVSQKHIEELRRRYIKILDELKICLTSPHSDSANELIQGISAAESLGELNLLQDKIIDMITNSVSTSQAKEKALAGLLIEVSAQLSEVERECLGLIESTAHVHLANNHFTSLIESEITELECSAESSRDVFEVRQLLSSRLGSIKSALETKKAEDRTRRQAFESTIQILQNDLKEMQFKIERDRKRRKHLESEALLDPLTGISNRRAIERHIKKEIKRHKQNDKVFSLIFIDIDDFKTINDTHSHRVGDKCLQSLVGRMQQVLRESDLMGRYGGDEFVVFLANTEQKAAEVVAKKLASAISKTCFIYRESEIHFSVSIGLTQVQLGDSDPEEIIARADSALLKAKNQGKDRIIVT